MPVGVMKVDRMRNFVILEFEFDAAAFEFLLRGKKTIMIGTKGEMKHSDVASS